MAKSGAWVAFLGLIAVGGGAWYYSDEIVRPTPHTPLTPGLAVFARDDSSITLPVTEQTRGGRVWYLEWPGGYGRLGERIGGTDSSVTRRFCVLAGTAPSAARVDLETYPFPGDPLSADGLAFEDVSVPARIGSFPAWRTDGPRSEWIVMVHGLAAGRGASLNTLGALASFGFPTLSISYRNDPTAPRSPDGHYHLGATEWQDLESAVAYARGHGARRVVLYGFSMGGAIVANFLRESPHRADVAAVILDAPALDWDAAVQLEAHRRHVPGWLTALAEAIVTLRTGFRWSGPEGRIPAGAFTTPVLLFHGTRDPTIPISSSTNLARAIPSQVTLVSTEGAGHVQSWNYDPAEYEDKLRTWLERTLGPARDTTGSHHL